VQLHLIFDGGKSFFIKAFGESLPIESMKINGKIATSQVNPILKYALELFK
jgi:hypothetical protein